MSTTAAIPTASIVTAISKSTMYTEIVEATFMGGFADLVTCLHTCTESWDYTGISGDEGTVYDIYGTSPGGADFRLAVTCVAF
jgi:hypothetical protein